MTQHSPGGDDAEHAGDSPEDQQRYEYDVAYNQWLNDNPIRQHRTAQQVWRRGRTHVMSQNLLATQLTPRRAPLTIQNWESGAVVPKDEGFASLAAFFRDPDIKEKWLNWRRRQPQSPVPDFIRDDMASESMSD